MQRDGMRRMNVTESPSKGSSYSKGSTYTNPTRGNRVSQRGSRPSANPGRTSTHQRPSANPGRSATSTGKIITGRGAIDKTRTKDFRCKQIRNSLLEMEKSIGIRSNGVDANSVNSDLPIEEFVKAYMSFIKRIPVAQRKKMVVGLQGGLSSFQMINNYVRYHQELRINFVGFDAIREIIIVLQAFKYNIDDVDNTTVSVSKGSKSTIKMKKVHYLNSLWTVLDIVDSVSTQARTTSYAYRYLRLFGVCLILCDYVTASVIADILLEQIALYSKLKGDK